MTLNIRDLEEAANESLQDAHAGRDVRGYRLHLDDSRATLAVAETFLED